MASITVMKRAKSSSKAAQRATASLPGSVSIRAMYADALREVMADPFKALAEYDPWLAALLRSCPSAPPPKP
jgi:hypothetical protein